MFKKILALALLLALVASGTPIHAQSSVTPVGRAITSDTAGGVAILVKYIGTSTSATTDVAVAAGGDMTFRVAGSADTAVNTVAAGSLCGATPGTLDLSTPAATCDTLGEVVDVINASGDWIAVLVDGLRTDSSDNTLFTLSVTSGVTTQGVALYFDAAVAVFASQALLPSGCQTDISCFITPANKLLANPTGGTYTSLRYLEGLSTWNTTSNFQVFSVKSTNKITGSFETVTTLFQTPAGATGVSAIPVALTAGPIIGRPHEKMVVRILDTSTGTAFRVVANGERRSVN